MQRQTFKLKFLEVNQEASKLVVSNRRAVVDEASNNMERGQVLTGIVKVTMPLPCSLALAPLPAWYAPHGLMRLYLRRSVSEGADSLRRPLSPNCGQAIKPYGAFVEVNGISGLLHISQVSYDRIDDLEKVLAFNQMVKVMIIDHDKVRPQTLVLSASFGSSPFAFHRCSGERPYRPVDQDLGARARRHAQGPQEGLRYGRGDRRQVCCNSPPLPVCPPALVLRHFVHLLRALPACA